MAKVGAVGIKMGNTETMARIRALDLWRGEVSISPLGGGRTNENYLVEDASKSYVVRLGEDIPVHHVLRFNELAASRAAHAAGLSPAVVLAEPGLTVIDYIHSKTLDEADVRVPGMLERMVPVIRACHHDIPHHFRGPALVFWVFHVVRDYAATMVEGGSPHAGLMAEFLGVNNALEQAAGPFEMVFGHNDLIAANLLDDGKKLWLIDWDYAGFSAPLFDLGGLASNCEFDDGLEAKLLELYFEAPVTGELLRRFHAMKTASLMRETMWSMVSEITSELDIDYASYTQENLTRFRRAHAQFLQT